MQTDTALEQQLELFFGCATLSAHSTFMKEGFRIRDMRFYVELFLNWTEPSYRVESLNPHNTQLSRYLSKLVTNGLAKKVGIKFKLHRSGILELLRQATTASYVHAPVRLHFLIYFLQSYRKRIEDIADARVAQFPPALRHELNLLLDVPALIQRESLKIDKEIELIERSFQRAYGATALYRSKTEAGVSLPEIATMIEREYPYDLNAQKPLSSFLAQLPKEQQIYELETGNICRAEAIWGPWLIRLKTQKALLGNLDGLSSKV